MITARFSILFHDSLVSEEEIAGNLAHLARSRSLDIVELEGGVRIWDGQQELLCWKFLDLNWVIAGLAQDLDALFRGESISVVSPGQTIRIRSAGETVVIDAGRRVAVPRRPFLRELYDLCRRFTKFWVAVAGESTALTVLNASPERHIVLFGGSVRKPTVHPVAVDIRRCDPSGYVFEFLVDDTLIRVGPLSGGLSDALSSIDRLTGGLAGLREGHVIVPVVLDLYTLWLTQQKVGSRQCVGICYRDVEAGLVERDEFDAECTQAISRFIQILPRDIRRP